ncbi:MAG: hypothetical protein JO286_07695 [Solirubrobacterales bacterium]|nr:hypothetical protein [Solirubrobacterales bacterium]MBV9684913.1 hypothetical protein [Solirubrobacterales bacterium]MBV9807048.1 hypothetical protein [Solirubrobacterales bacterium]
MDTQVEAHRSHTPVVRKVGAGLVLIIAAALAIKLALGIVVWLFWTVVTVAVVVAIIWALKTLIW